MSTALSQKPDFEASPEWITALSGVEFNSADEVWQLTPRTRLNVGRLKVLYSGEMFEGLLIALASLAVKRAAGTLLQCVSALRHYAIVMGVQQGIDNWNIDHLRIYRVKINEQFGHEEYLSKLRTVLKECYALRVCGVSAQLIQDLAQMTLKQVETGRAVRIADASNGPLIPTELHHLTADVYRAAEVGTINLEQLSLVLFHIDTGRRTVQSANLKCCDVDGSRKSDDAENNSIYLMHVPRAKQKGHRFREEFRSIFLTESHFALFAAQREMVKKRFSALLQIFVIDIPRESVDKLASMLPLYPSWEHIEASLDEVSRTSRSTSWLFQSLLNQAQSEAWHCSVTQIIKRVKETCRLAGALDRDSKPLMINIRRLRYTKGTELARQGVGRSTLSWLMDHSNLRTASVYVDNLPDHAAQIDSALKASPLLSKMAAMFRGTLVKSEANAVGGEAPQLSRISYEGCGTATCSVNKSCGFNDGVPLACYTCDSFQPWLDGPHSELLTKLEAERNADALALGEDHPMTTRRDKTINAVRHVVLLCRSLHMERVES